MNKKTSEIPQESNEWARVRDSIKTRWVVAVLAFWITVAILVLVYILDRKLNLILLSIALGSMIIGIWLKVRFRMHQNKEPAKQVSGSGGE